MAQTNLRFSTSGKEKLIRCLGTHKHLLILVALCFTVSLIFCSNELPSGSDVPSHYIKILEVRDMLKEGKFVRWSYKWYSGYAMFDRYPPLVYILAASVSLLVKDVAVVMKGFTAVAFSSFPILLYRLGRVLGRSPKGATLMALLFSVAPINIFFLFNGYFVLLISLPLMFIFLIEFCRYLRNRSRTSLLVSTAMLSIISVTYHRTLYFILFILLFHFLLKIYRKQIRDAVSVAFMTFVGVGISSVWLVPAVVNMLTFQSEELYQSLTLAASHGGVSFQLIMMTFIVPYGYLVVKRIKKTKVHDDLDLTLLISLIFFTLLTMGPYGLLQYIIPFSSSQRVEVALLMATFLATVTASSLFDERITVGRRTFYGILLSSIIFLTTIIGIFLYPNIALGLKVVDFNYSRDGLHDSLVNLINDAYVQEQVFLGKQDANFLKVLQHVSNENRCGRIVFYSNRSQTVDMFYYYALLPLSGKSTPQGIAPEGEGDLKWDVFTERLIWSANETLLELSDSRWIVSNYPIVFVSDYSTHVFGQYTLYELDDAETIPGSRSTIISRSTGEIDILLDQEYTNVSISESYHPRWRAFDQNGNEVRVERTEYGFMRITSRSAMNEVRLVYSDTVIDVVGKITSIICLILGTLFFTYGYNRRRVPQL